MDMAYVSCGLGVHYVGYIMMFFGVCTSCVSILLSSLVRLFGRMPIFTTAYLLNLAFLISAVYWKPRPADKPIFFLLIGVRGMVEAVWLTQFQAFYGILFPGDLEAGYSNLVLWRSIGHTIGCLCSTFICISTKITLILVIMTVGMLGYYTTEVAEWRKKGKYEQRW